METMLYLDAPNTADEAGPFQVLLSLLHPGGVVCPRCGEPRRRTVHRRHRYPVLDYRCLQCRRVFNAWTGTVLQNTHHRPSELLVVLDAVLKKESTAALARRLRCQRSQLKRLRRRLQGWVRETLLPDPQLCARVRDPAGLLGAEPCQGRLAAAPS
jgi:transposase-like protein